MQETEPWTIQRLLEWTTGYFLEHGSDSARLDAEVLLAEACSCNRIDLYTRFDEVAEETVKVAFRELVRRRADGMPVAYLVGHREFYSLNFRITPDVLIPRPETEFVVITLLDLIKETPKPDGPLRIADVGTGSGILAVCAALNVEGAQITAIDCSDAALEIARYNAKHHEVDSAIEFVSSDLLSGFPDSAELDFVISNPPYVSENEYHELDASVRQHEPREALVGGPTGTEVIARLIPQSAQRLKSGGWLIMEISPMIANNVADLFRINERFQDVELIKDLAQHPRVVKARKV